MKQMNQLFLTVTLFALRSLRAEITSGGTIGSGTDSAQVYCSDQSTPGFQSGTDAAKTCYCDCVSGGDPHCLTLDDISTKYEQSLSTGSLSNALEILAGACVENELSPAECRGERSAPSFETCSDVCLLCDETSVCEEYDGAYKCVDGGCYKLQCALSEDSRGNVYATVDKLQQMDDSQLFCSDTCGSDRDYNASAPEPCSESIVGDDGCYYPCQEQELQGATSLSTVIADSTALRKLIDFCADINPDLQNCPLSKIVPGDRQGCGCPVCEYECPLEEAFFLRENTCYRKACTQTTSTTEDSTFAGTIDQYVNTFCECSMEQVDVARCSSTATTSAPSGTTTSDCDSPCGNVRNPVCYESGSGELITYECPEAAKCAYLALREEGFSADELHQQFTLRNYGECSDDSTVCTVGDIIVSDERAPNSKCGYLGVCVTDAAGDAVMVKTTVEEALPKLKEYCFDTLGTSTDLCTADGLYYSPNDDTLDSFVCRLSAESFGSSSDADSQVSRDDGTGCTYKGCVDNALTAISYATGDVIDPTSPLAVNCGLQDCVNGITTNGFCGTCPSCLQPADPCSRSSLDFTEPCIEDPLEDDTRGDDEDIAGRCRLQIGLKFCADRFLDMSRDEIYAAIKTAALRLAEECPAVGVFDYLRTAITQFDLDVELDADSSDCTLMIAIQIGLDFSDVDLERLRHLKACLEETGLDVRLAAALQTATASVDLNGEEITTVVEVDSSAAMIELTTAAGDIIFEVETTSMSQTTTTSDGGSGPGDQGNSGEMQQVIGMSAVFVAFFWSYLHVANDDDVDDGGSGPGDQGNSGEMQQVIGMSAVFVAFFWSYFF
eukprot:CAMPEP_0202725968 /NCGR_PEP_ID=MMETSP1385-20130828/184369_1 /ASSEMBLY_ACC=CAM_ASM_000861 /TAXON_ID=933848 /ORGANISM="Elphidium margaritaceum" /LENGTH=836 /DNA_ID=CAMNT_0049392173 /DNA_START=62 /DNA_END=2573 /DNA_ORIENTATION=+